jgi:hypothetical protein
VPNEQRIPLSPIASRHTEVEAQPWCSGQAVGRPSTHAFETEMSCRLEGKGRQPFSCQYQEERLMVRKIRLWGGHMSA